MKGDSGIGIRHSGKRIADVIADGVTRLREVGVDNPALDARLLIGHALGLDRAQLLSGSQHVVGADEVGAIEALLMRRIKRESVARIIGKREFWGLEFGLNEATLEPRPDSEILVEVVLSSYRPRVVARGRLWPVSSARAFRRRQEAMPDCLHKPGEASWRRRAARQESLGSHDSFTDKKTRILDLGTGTGCLLLALLHEMPEATGIGVDINPRAAEQARRNAAALGLGERASFRVGDWFDSIEKSEKFDIIVSNPPYIPAADIPTLMPEVRAYDPLPALDGGADGLQAYRLLIPQMKDFLTPQGFAALEVGQGQARQVEDLLRRNGFREIKAHQDLSGIDRCITAHI